MKTIIASLAVSVLIAPIVTSAQSNADLQNQAQTLLQQVAQLQAQLAAQGGTSAGTPSSLNPNPTGLINAPTSIPAAITTPASANTCPQIGRVIKKGSSGADVTRLQQYLALDPSVYPEGTASGYYGALTEKAVQRWQVKYNIVSNGTPATTGYGVVGPRTAAAIALLCATGASSPVGGYIQVSPISGNAPLNVTVVATVNSTNSCASAIYQLSWGDGTNPMSIPVSSNVCTQISQTLQHTYTAGGTYQITLSAGAHQTGATITVIGGAQPVVQQPVPSTPSTPTIAAETFTATPISGSAPLSVTFSGVVTGQDQGWCAGGCSDILVFGDGQQGAVPLPKTQTASQNYTLTHTYSSNGTYTATLYQGSAGSGRPTVGTPITIVVGTGGSAGATYNPPSLTPGVGGNPLAVSLQFDNGAGCPAYTLTWGDGSNDNYSGGGSCPSVTKNHTYAQKGTYTVTLVRGTQTNTVGVNISN